MSNIYVHIKLLLMFLTCIIPDFNFFSLSIWFSVYYKCKDSFYVQDFFSNLLYIEIFFLYTLSV